MGSLPTDEMHCFGDKAVFSSSTLARLRNSYGMQNQSNRRPQRRPQTQQSQSEGRVVAYSSPETGFKGYTFEVSEALKELRREAREVRGGLLGPLRAAAELQRAQDQRNQAFQRWLSDVMRKEQELAKRVAFTTLKRRDQMLQEVGPDWYQPLSWDQMETTNQLQAVLRADVEESSTTRVAQLLSRLGLSPVPSGRALRKAMRDQPEDHERFLLALYARVSASGAVPATDTPAPDMRTGFEYTPSERLLLSALAHLRLPHVLKRLEQEFGPVKPHPPYLRIIQEDTLARCQDKYLWPYLEPQPIPPSDWLELANANHAVHLENLYIRSHVLPPPLVRALVPRPEKRAILSDGKSKKRASEEEEENTKASEPAAKEGNPPAADADRDGRVGSAGVDPASIVSLLSTLASEGDPLCQLPEVHKLPAIQKWVRMRNGLQYVHRKLAEVLADRSLIMWNANHAGMAYRVPSPHHGLTPPQARGLTWDRREWYRRRVNRIMGGYYKALRTIQVNAARELFPAMACDYFPSRDKFLRTFFAYMPKHERDMVVVKPWGPGEYNEKVMPLWRNRYYANKKKIEHAWETA